MYSSSNASDLQTKMRLQYLANKLKNQTTFAKQQQKTVGLRTKLAASYGNRIPIPGGGSSNVMKDFKKPEVTVMTTKPKSTEPFPKFRTKIKKEDNHDDDVQIIENISASSTDKPKGKPKFDLSCRNGDASVKLKKSVANGSTRNTTRVTSLVESIIAAQNNIPNVKPPSPPNNSPPVPPVRSKPAIISSVPNGESSKSTIRSGSDTKVTEAGSSSTAIIKPPPPPPIKRTITLIENNKPAPKKVKIYEADGGIAQVIAEKRKNYDNMTVSPMKPLGPPPITTKKMLPGPTSSVLQSQISCLPKELHLKSFSTDPVLLRILEWSVQWIRESKSQTKSPPISDKPLIRPPLSYPSYNAYYDTFEPLVLHEIWAQVTQSYESERTSIVLMFAISSYELIDGFLKLECQTTVTAQDYRDQKYLTEGDLAILELLTELTEKRVVFGYIQDLVAEEITDRTPISRVYRVPPGHRMFLRYIIKIKFRQVKLDIAQPMRARGLYYLKPMMRNIEALLAIQNSKLCEDILCPRMVTCQITVPPINFKGSDYNESQLKAILAAVEAVQRPYTMPKLLMVQGPPGTGKTTTLIGMIKKLFESWEDTNSTPKVLVCAPSNGAIDEIAARLYSVRNTLSQTKLRRGLRLVRIGLANQIHPAVRKISLDELVNENMARSKSDATRGIQEKIDKLEKEIATKDRLCAEYRARNNKETLDKCLSELYQHNREIEFLRKELKSSEMTASGAAKQRMLRADILKKADVVLSTLNSCRQSLLEGVYHSDRDPCQFNCVIIDEASQCCEPEILMPLTYTSISKMILIGDPMQLPATVISTIASEHNYDRSLFERFFHHFGGHSASSPVLVLDTQYRMHSSICKFPSQQFYNNRLKTPQELDQRSFPIKPYMIIDIKGTSFDQSNCKNLFNELEADFVANIYGAVRDLCPRDTTVGIITPYQGQKKLLTNKLEKTYPEVDVNTIDGFQGQERDVIIISLVRDFSRKENGIGFLGSANRLNVALTRARHSLIICISDIGEINNNVWKNLLEDAASRNVLIQTSCKVKNGLAKLIAK